ncbi:MAG TPA: phage major capsid protein, partial [Planctomycetota bacterium]|nr:phage major capsid protein [Planctomycetota bacterium]
MAKKEELQRQLQELEAKLLEFRDKPEQTAEDMKVVNSVCDDIEEITALIEGQERSERTIASLRAPAGDHADPGAPGNGEQRGFKSFGEYLQAVARAATPRGGELAGLPCGVYDRRLASMDPELRSSGMEETLPSSGGFLVQKDFSNDLFTKAHDAAIVWNKTRQIPISGRSNGLKIPGIDEVSRIDGSRWGGITTYWLDEGGTKTSSKPKFMLIELNLHKLIGLCYATDELLEDAGALEAVVRQGFVEEFSFKMDDAVIRGTGAGQPLGILPSPSVVNFTRSSAGTICDTDVMGMWARLWPGSQANAEWYTNVEVLPSMMAMTLGAAGYVPLWLPANQLYGSPNMTLMGKPLHVIEQAAAEGTNGDLMLLDLSQYVTIAKGGMQAASSIHVQFVTDETAFRFVIRIDGQPLWNNSLTPYKGTDTVSP